MKYLQQALLTAITVSTVVFAGNEAATTTANELLSTANIFIDKTIRHQKMIGFGGGLVFHIYPFIHPKKDELYDSIFNNAQINVLRICNWYNPQEQNDVEEIAMLKEIKKKWPQVKMMLASWSPPPYLKSNDSWLGNKVVTDSPLVQVAATLKKNSDSTYMYAEYADYWFKSIQHFRDSGIVFDWISIQNEPDVHTDYEGCLLDSVETPSHASYGKALDAVYNVCKGKFDPPVQFIGPDLAGLAGRLANYLSSNELDKNQLSAYSHHNYDYAAPNWLRDTYSRFSDKPLFQTEFLVNEGTDWQGIERSWFDHAKIIMNMLTIEHVQIYNIFSLAYKPASTHCFFSLDTLGNDTYTIRPTWHMFRHFSRSIHRGWQHVAGHCDDPEILSGYFESPKEDSATILMINTGSEPKTVHYTVPLMRGTLRQTSDSLHYADRGTLASEGTVTLPVKSISSLDFHWDTTAMQGIHHTRNTFVNQRKTGLYRLPAAKNGTLRVDYTIPKGAAVLSLCDIRGREVSRRTIVAAAGKDTHGTAHISPLPAPGLYTVTLQTGSSRYIRPCIIHR